MQLHDVANLIIAASSLAISLVALFIAKRVAVVSISTPLVLQELYEIAEHLDGRRLGTDPVADMDRLKQEIDLVRKKDFILRKTGFAAELDAFETSVTQFVQIQRALHQKKAPDITPEEKDTFLQTLRAADSKLQALLKRIRSKLDSVYEDPFDKDA